MLAFKFVVLVVLLAADQFQSINAAGLSQNAGSIESLFPASFQTLMKATAKGMMDLVVPKGLEQAMANQTQPASQAVIGPTVRFYLFADPRDPSLQEELFTGDLETLKKSHYDASKPVVFLIHGWFEFLHYRFIFPWSTKNAYFEAGNDYNIIIVDYSRTTGFLTYVLSVSIGLIESIDQGSAFIEWLLENNLIDLDQTHIVGYSLGAHVGGGIGARFKKNNGPIARLTGIDPAGPGFYPNMLAPHVISQDDAKYVDVIHSNALVFGFGIQKRVGHVDFYVNGGQRQPICVETVCNHLFAPYYFEDSVRKGADKAERCACASNPMSPDSHRQCCDVKVAFGEYNNGTVGEYYMPYPLYEVMSTIKRAVSTPFRDAVAN